MSNNPRTLLKRNVLFFSLLFWITVSLSLANLYWAATTEAPQSFAYLAFAGAHGLFAVASWNALMGWLK